MKRGGRRWERELENGAERSLSSEYVRERLRQADAFVPPGTALDFADGKRQADEEELRAAREHQAHVEASTPCALWLEDLRELYPVLQQELARPVWYKEDEE